MSSNSLACVLGDMDLVRPLGICGINCAVAVQPGAPPRYSRYTRAVIDWANPWEEAEALVQNLIEFGKAQPEPPILYYESDGELLLVSRYRKPLGEVFQFVVPEQELVEELVDKERFQELASRIHLPVPEARRLHPEKALDVEQLDLPFPVIIKPLTRRPELWRTAGAEGKALRINSAAELMRLWPTLAASGVEVLAQQYIEGPETRIESYHVYVDRKGEIVGEFTGRKIRTYPLEFGDSTALVTTDAADVLSLGRELVDRIGLQGVAKFDFKRGADGTLALLEINPRFNLWHHLGALAGVNLPALVFRDLTGQSRTAKTVARAGVTWCRAWQDIQAARALKLPLRSWLAWVIGCDAKRLLAWNDPKPILFAGLWRLGHAIRSRIWSRAPRLASSPNQPDPGTKGFIGQQNSVQKSRGQT
jgi:predicted ATP-grasp superfamily ATP-dependent carboligase